MSIPKRRHPFWNFFADIFIYEIALAGLALIAALIAINSTPTVDNNSSKKFYVVLFAALVFLATFIKSLVSFCSRQKSKSTHELEGCLHTLYSVLGDADESKLRITIHVPVKKDSKLEQVIDYVGDGTKAKAGRQIPANCGVIGKAFQEKKMVSGVRTSVDHSQYVDELVAVWNFLRNDAEKVNPATKAWFAIPLVRSVDGEDRVEGVIYLDSINKDFFTEDRRDLIAKAAIGIARFIGKRYG